MCLVEMIEVVMGRETRSCPSYPSMMLVIPPVSATNFSNQRKRSAY